MAQLTKNEQEQQSKRLSNLRHKNAMRDIQIPKEYYHEDLEEALLDIGYLEKELAAHKKFIKNLKP